MNNKSYFKITKEYILEQLKNQVSLYKVRKIRLHALVSDLDAYISAFDDLKPEWQEDFRKEWRKLEEVNARLLDPESPKSDDLYSKIIKEALENIMNIIAKHEINEKS